MIEVDGYKFRLFVDRHRPRVRIKHYVITPANMFFPWVGNTKNWYWVCRQGSNDPAEWATLDAARDWIQSKRMPVWEEVDE